MNENQRRRFRVQTNVGKAQHVVSFHDGVKTHSDGSPFFDVKICSSKRKLASFIRQLKTEGYVEI